MATFSWPAAVVPTGSGLALSKNVKKFRSPFSKTPQTSDLLADRWLLSVNLPPAGRIGVQTLPGAIDAMMKRLDGGLDWVSAWNFGRPVPAGTARGSPTLSAGASRGDSTLAVTGFTASGTLKAGDMLGAGGQLFMVRDDITLNGSGAGTVALVNRVRATIASASGVAWNKPTVTFGFFGDVSQVVYAATHQEPAVLDLEEIW